MLSTMRFIRAALWAVFIIPICARLIYSGNTGAAAMVAILCGILVNHVTRSLDE